MHSSRSTKVRAYQGFLECMQGKIIWHYCPTANPNPNVCRPDIMQCTAAYLELMQTVVEALKHHPVDQLKEADIRQVLHSPRLVLESREGPRGRRGASHPPGAQSDHRVRV